MQHGRQNNQTNLQYRSAINLTGVAQRAPTGKNVGRWLKDRREKKKEEMRAHNAQLHAKVSVAGLASAIAAMAALTAASSRTGKDQEAAQTDVAVASAATLVAAQCVEAAEAMGADRELLASVVSSAVRVQSPGDVMTLTAAASTGKSSFHLLYLSIASIISAFCSVKWVVVDASFFPSFMSHFSQHFAALRGAATMKARALKDVWNIAAVLPAEKGMSMSIGSNSSSCSHSGELFLEDNFRIGSRELLARGCELLKRTRKGIILASSKTTLLAYYLTVYQYFRVIHFTEFPIANHDTGDLHWKIVSVYINRMNQVS